jgi:hypothetical protein
MKTFSKISSVIIVAAMAAAFSSTAGDITVKPLRYQSPSQSVFTEKVTPTVAMNCPACKSELVSAVTQDAKLRTKTVLVESHACKACSTTIVRTGAQKATGKDVSQHTCGGLLAAAETCSGCLWIGTESGGIVRREKGAFEMQQPAIDQRHPNFARLLEQVTNAVD